MYGHNRSFLGPGLAPVSDSSWDAPKVGNSAYAMFKKHMVDKRNIEH